MSEAFSGNGQKKTDQNPRGAGRPPDGLKKHPAWLRLKENILGIGTERFWEEMDKLSGKDYIITYLEVLKYFKPRLANQITKDIVELPTIELVDSIKQLVNGRSNGNGQSSDVKNSDLF